VQASQIVSTLVDEKFSAYGEVCKNILKDKKKYMEEISKEI
jgi:hypothetical protein